MSNIFFMNKIYINIYNNLVNLSRNKNIYIEFTSNDSFSDRLHILLIHFAFFLKNIKNKENQNKIQIIHDNFFYQLELNLREIGYGDAKINKNMKSYINSFFHILNKIVKWENFSNIDKESEIRKILDIKISPVKLVDYFNRFDKYLKKSSLIPFSKGVIKHKF